MNPGSHGGPALGQVHFSSSVTFHLLRFHSITACLRRAHRVLAIVPHPSHTVINQPLIALIAAYHQKQDIGKI